MQSIRNERFANLRAPESCAAKTECSKLQSLIIIVACTLALMLYGCSKPGVSESISRENAKDETAPLFPALALMDATSFDRIKIAETDAITYLTSDAYLPGSADGNLGILSGEALDEKGVLSLGEASVGQMPDTLKAFWGNHGIDMVEPKFWPDRSITSAAFEDAGEPGMEYCHLCLSCGLIDTVYVIFQKMDSEYIPCYVLVNNCERTEGFAYTMFSGMDWAVYRSTSERGTGVSETTVSWLNLSKGKHELIYAEHRTEQESFMNQSCPSQTIESTLQSIEDDSLHLEVAMCFELSSESNTLSRTEKKTDMAIYYTAEIGGFYIKLPPEAYLLSPLQLDPISLQEYLLMFGKQALGDNSFSA